MAGIGFELKKLFSKKGIFKKVKAVGYSAVIILGPSIMCMALLFIFNGLLKKSHVSLVDREFFQATIMYSFVFSVLITSGFSLVLTRYISDKIYKKEYKDIKASLYGVLTLITIISAAISVAFYSRAPINFYYKIFSIMLFIELSAEQVISVYISSLKKYKLILLGFLSGMISAVVLQIILINFTGIDKLICSICAFFVGIMIVMLIMIFSINKYFTSESSRYFEFLLYFKRYYHLFFINTFYFLGLYIHNFIFWCISDVNRVLYNTFVYAPVYDVPSFFAFLTTISINVIFIVKFETSFAQKWDEYLDKINNNASYIDIENSKKGMIAALKSELEYIIIFQFIISISWIAIGYNIMPMLGLTGAMQDIYRILILAYYSIAVTFVLITILLYFDDRKGAFYITVFFVTTNFICTLITVYLGRNYYGFGTFISGILLMIIGLYRIQHFIKNIDYYIFCKNSAWN